MTTLDQLREPVAHQSEIDSGSAAVLRVSQSVFALLAVEWDLARQENARCPFPGADLAMIDRGKGDRMVIGYVGALGSDGRPYLEFRSKEDPKTHQHVVYALTETGAIEFAGRLYPISWWRSQARRQARSERSYRHDGLYRNRAGGRYDDE